MDHGLQHVRGGTGPQPPRTRDGLANSVQKAHRLVGFTELLIQAPNCTHKRFGEDVFPLPPCLLGEQYLTLFGETALINTLWATPLSYRQTKELSLCPKERIGS